MNRRELLAGIGAAAILPSPVMAQAIRPGARRGQRGYPLWFRPGNVSRHRVALDRVRGGTTDMKILCLGDSKTIGVGAGTGSSGTVDARQNGYPVWLAQYLNGHGIPAAALDNFFGYSIGSGGTDTRLTLNSGWAGNGQTVFGVSLRNSTNTNALSFTPVNAFDTFDLYYVRASGFATFTVDVDGGAALATINSAGTNAVIKQTISCDLGTHTINIQRNGTGTNADIIGIDCYDSTTKRVRILGAGRSGVDTTTVNNSGAFGSLTAAAVVAADTTIIDLGTNDMTVPQSLKTPYQSIINSIRAYSDIFMCVPTPLSAATPAGDQLGCMTQLVSIANIANLSLINHMTRWGSYTRGVANGWTFDGLHPTKLGYQEVAPAIGRALLF